MICKIIQGDCFDIMKTFENETIDIIITSPPYNFGKNSFSVGKNTNGSSKRYDVFKDNNINYIDWTINLFKEFERILKPTGVILYNLNYNYKEPSLPQQVVVSVENNTKIKLKDNIAWVKNRCLPITNKTSLSRKWENIFVFSKQENYYTNKKINSVKNNQNYYKAFYNVISTENNDGINPYNKATYPKELITKLLEIYGLKGGLCFDPFSGVGTTQLACKDFKINCIGCELSINQINYFNKNNLKIS